MSIASGSGLDNLLTKSGFSSTVDLSKPVSYFSGKQPERKVPNPRDAGVITIEELENIKLRAVGLNDRTIEALKRTKTKMELHDKSRSRMANWDSTAENYLQRRQ